MICLQVRFISPQVSKAPHHRNQSRLSKELWDQRKRSTKGSLRQTRRKTIKYGSKTTMWCACHVNCRRRRHWTSMKKSETRIVSKTKNKPIRHKQRYHRVMKSHFLLILKNSSLKKVNHMTMSNRFSTTI